MAAYISSSSRSGYSSLVGVVVNKQLLAASGKTSNLSGLKKPLSLESVARLSELSYLHLVQVKRLGIAAMQRFRVLCG